MKPRLVLIRLVVPALCWATVLGCAMASRREVAVSKELKSVNADVAEEARALTTGALDAVALAPTNAPTSLALRLLRRDQQIVGIPRERIEIEAILAGQSVAIAGLEDRLKGLDQLLMQRDRLQITLADTQTRLVDMGRLYEAEHAKKWWHKLFAGLGLTGTLAAVIALCVFFPPALAILGHLIGWIVAKLPALAGFLGAVSTKAFDAVSKGVEKTRYSMGPQAAVLEDALSKSMDQNHKDLVQARRSAGAVGSASSTL